MARAVEDSHRRDSLAAAARTTLVTLALTGLAVLLGLLLPRRPRQAAGS